MEIKKKKKYYLKEYSHLATGPQPAAAAKMQPQKSSSLESTRSICPRPRPHPAPGLGHFCHSSLWLAVSVLLRQEMGREPLYCQSAVATAQVSAGVRRSHGEPACVAEELRSRIQPVKGGGEIGGKEV